MRVPAVIFSTLSTVAGMTLVAGTGGGCGWVFGTCDNPDEPFMIDESITPELVERVLDDNGGGTAGPSGASAEDVAALTCEDFCRAVADPDGFRSVTVENCTFDIGDYMPPAGTSDGSSGGGDTVGSGSGTDAGSGTSVGTGGSMVVGSLQCDGTVYEPCTGGRRPLGHVAACPGGEEPVGRSFAALAHLEAASVVAFVQLARQLEDWGAPEHLVRECKRAARDEVHHAALMARFAGERGAVVPQVRCSASAEDLLTAAIHNATEGCVNETWAALLAHVQARRASDARVRDAYAIIATDETRHAQLAWDLHAWFLSRLDGDGRRLVMDAQREAIAGLSALARAQGHVLPGELGLPDAEQAVRMAEHFGSLLAAA